MTSAEKYAASPASTKVDLRVDAAERFRNPLAAVRLNTAHANGSASVSDCYPSFARGVGMLEVVLGICRPEAMQARAGAHTWHSRRARLPAIAEQHAFEHSPSTSSSGPILRDLEEAPAKCSVFLDPSYWLRASSGLACLEDMLSASSTPQPACWWLGGGGPDVAQELLPAQGYEAAFASRPGLPLADWFSLKLWRGVDRARTPHLWRWSSRVEQGERHAQRLLEEWKVRAGATWEEPFTSLSAWGETTFEWWHGTHKLTIYLSGQGLPEFIRVWGSDVDDEMREGQIGSPDEFAALWSWLLQG